MILSAMVVECFSCLFSNIYISYTFKRAYQAVRFVASVEEVPCQRSRRVRGERQRSGRRGMGGHQNGSSPLFQWRVDKRKSTMILLDHDGLVIGKR
jgi:hypothetical protein